MVARLARALLDRCRSSAKRSALERELALVRAWLPRCSNSAGCATLNAAKILGETADVERFRSRHAYARHNGTAPVPVWSGNRERHRLSRIGNRQLNTALHRIAITQARYHPPRASSSNDAGQRRHQDRIDPRPQTAALRRRLPGPAGRRRTLSAAGSDHRGGLT